MIVSLLTDYGQEDDFVGVVHGVIAGIAPDVRVIDISHGMPHYGVQRGALVLARSLPYLPPGVHVAVVDPQVGTERRGLALRCAEEDRLLVGPDNGLLSLAWERFGGVVEAIDITRSPHRLEPVSATFHGRDLFAPVAAHLAAGAELADAGEPVEPEELQVIELPEPRTEDGTLVAHVLSLDRYGNAALNVGHEILAGSGLTLGRAVELEVGGERRTATFTHTFADVPSGGVLVYEDAYRSLAVAVNRGDAAAALGLKPASRCACGRESLSRARPTSPPPPPDRLYQRAGEGARRRGRAARHARDRRRAERRPRSSGPRVERAARVVGAGVGGAARVRRAAAPHRVGGGGRGL